jgi:hypothetical protein
VIKFNTVSVRVNTNGWIRKRYLGEIEIFLVYCPDNERTYCVPVDVCPGGSCSMRVAPTANNQAAGVRWARDYELPE